MQQDSLLDFIAQQNVSGTDRSSFLKELTEQYPYFTPAQFYLLQQSSETDAAYHSQAAKTALLFNNPHWLQYQLQPHETIAITQHTIVQQPVETVTEEQTNENEVVSAFAEQHHEIVAEPSLAPELLQEETTVEPVAEPARSLTQEALMLAEDPDATDDTEMEEEIAPVVINIPGLKEVPLNEHLPAFEPMHMVDYFASQGIKLTDEVQTADKLGKQLKSFTEWLKTMKKVHIPGNEVNAGVSDIAIQALAAKSNKEGEIVTEAMAEVLIQQGKAGKAIEVYKKLSLLNPSKSAFFAAKIEQLKGS
jgi:hypothetical protein